jgi:hypoxanthine phosphoribosyltransferase
VLVADDVADTGRTLELVRDSCAGHVTELRTAVVYEEPHSVVRYDCVWSRTDRWIDLPWSSQPPMRTRSSRPAR